MNSIGILFSLVSVALLLTLPRPWGLVPLLIAATYVPFSQVIEIGPFHFPVIRILISLGFFRVIMKGERMAGGLNIVDKLVILWASWFVGSSVLHESSTLITRLGEVYTDLGVYFLSRVFIQGTDDILNLFKIACILFVPLAVGMFMEKLMTKNYFSLLFGGTGEAYLRNGHVRAKGPFGHPITAGTAGAVCLPMALYLWRQRRQLALAGIAATGIIVVTSRSSGPMMTALSILAAMALWRMRSHMRMIRWGAILAIVALNFVMSEPVYFLIARVDLAGGSTSWYRARMIQSAIQHLDEWWLAGTDYTRHWMHVGVGENNCDITNYYVQVGVWGGLPLLLLFIGILFVAFAAVGKALRLNQGAPSRQRFLIWTLGSILFGHAATFFSISYFDQIAIFFYLTLAAVGSLCPAVLALTSAVPQDEQGSFERLAEPQITHG